MSRHISRQKSWSRRMVAETRLTVSDLMLPLIMTEGSKVRRPLFNLPGLYCYSLDQMDAVLDEALDVAIPSLMLIPDMNAEAPDRMLHVFTQEILPALSDRKMPIGLVVDLHHQYFNTLFKSSAWEHRWSHEQWLESLLEQLIAVARAGAQAVVLPGHLPGCVRAAKKLLQHHGLGHVLLIAHVAHYASCLHFPASSSMEVLDRRPYLLDIANAQEVLHETQTEVDEGADWLMVQPATLSLDIFYRLHLQQTLPIFAYHVPGEYIQSRLYAEACGLNPTRVMVETLLAIKRSGARVICTHAALDVARELMMSP